MFSMSEDITELGLTMEYWVTTSGAILLVLLAWFKKTKRDQDKLGER
jgi:hypothetical protein